MITLRRNDKIEKFTLTQSLKKDSISQVSVIRSCISNERFILKKIILSSDKNIEQDQIKRYTNELKALSKLNNPYLVKYITHYRSIDQERSFNIIMEFVDGSDLSKQIRTKKKNSFYQIIEWIIYICIGLLEVHKNNIIHRNIKPDNLFLTKDNKIKIGNFGLSKCLDSEQDSGKTDIGHLLYRAPETFAKKLNYSKKVDMWSLGVVIYELITFNKPISNLELYNSIESNQQRWKLEPLPKDVPHQLKEITNKLLSYDPSERPSPEEILKMKIIQERINILIQEKKIDQKLVSNVIEEQIYEGMCIYCPDEEEEIKNKSSKELNSFSIFNENSFQVKDNLKFIGNRSFSSQNSFKHTSQASKINNSMDNDDNCYENENYSNFNNNPDDIDDDDDDYVNDYLMDQISNNERFSCKEDIEKFKNEIKLSLIKENKSQREIRKTLKQIDKISSLFISENETF